MIVQVADISTTPDFLEKVVRRLPSRAAAPPTLAPLIPQHTAWRSRDPEGRQHGSTPLAYSGHH